MSLEFDLSGLTTDALRALAEECRAQGQERIVAALEPSIQLAIVVMELEKRAKAAVTMIESGRPWWAALKVGDKIRTARAGIPVYRANRQALDRTISLDYPPMTVAEPAQGAPIVGEWVCVNGPPKELWVRGADCKLA